MRFKKEFIELMEKGVHCDRCGMVSFNEEHVCPSPTPNSTVNEIVEWLDSLDKMVRTRDVIEHFNLSPKEWYNRIRARMRKDLRVITVNRGEPKQLFWGTENSLRRQRRNEQHLAEKEFLEKLQQAILNKELTICETCDEIFPYVPQRLYCDGCQIERRKNYRKWMEEITNE